jgi:hypothetical protein
MHGDRSKRYLQLLRVVLLEEGLMANGPAQVHRQMHGRTATVDMRPKIAGRLVSTVLLEVTMTVADLAMTTDHPRHRRLEGEDRRGVTGQMGDKPIYRLHLAQVIISFRMCPATVPMEVTVAVAVVVVVVMQVLQPVTSISQVTMAQDDHVSPTTGNGEAHATPATPERDITMRGRIAAGATVIETASEAAIRETLDEIGERAGRAHAVQSVGIGTVTPETTTSIGGASRAAVVQKMGMPTASQQMKY